MNSRTFYGIAIGFLAGVGTLSLFSIPRFTIWICFTCISIWIAYALLTKKSSHVILYSVVLLSLTLGALRTEYARETLHPLDVLIESKVTLMGTICDEPQTKTTSQSICFLPDTAPDKILISTNPYPAFTYGDRLEIRGKLTVPENFTAYEGGPEFNYVSYLGKDGIRYTMFRPAIKLIEKSRLSLQKILFDIKHAFTRKAEQLLPEPESSLLGGILLGDKQGLSKETTLEFKNAGLIHILVLSGYNVTIVAESLMKMFSFLPRAFGHSLGFISIILFALMTGASSTTVRASIMALIAIGGRVGARRYDVTRALISAGLCMVVVNPDILVFDISFQLSFMSTLALIYVSPLVSDRLGFITKRGNLRDMIATTLATQILVAPYIIYSMGQISLISLVSNIFVGPIIPYAMFVGFGALVLGFVHPFIGLPLAWITTLMLSYILHATSFFGNLPFASIQIHTGVVTLVCMYVIYIIFLRREWRRKNSVPPSAS